MSGLSFPRQDTPKSVVVIATTLAVCLSLFQLWQPLVGFLPVGTLPFERVLGQQPATYFRPIHLAWILVLGFAVYPIAKDSSPARLFDLLAMICVLA